MHAIGLKFYTCPCITLIDMYILKTNRLIINIILQILNVFAMNVNSGYTALIEKQRYAYHRAEILYMNADTNVYIINRAGYLWTCIKSVC
jgi:hypothetical protein